MTAASEAAALRLRLDAIRGATGRTGETLTSQGYALVPPSLPTVRIGDKPNARRSRVNRPAKKKLNWSPKSANGMIIPVQYGPGFAGENVFAAGKNGNNLVIGSIVALGEIEEITKVYINDVDASGIAGVTVTEYTGTTAQTADATLASVFGGYADTLVLSVNGTNIGVAYVVVEIAPGAIDSAPRITVKYKGLKNIEDTRIPNTAYYTNSALCFRNWLKSAVYGPGLSVDDTAFEALADHCDTVPADDWQASHNYALGDFCKPTGANANNRMYEVTTDAGSSGGTEPASWDDTLGNTTDDSGITWTCRDGRRHVCGMPMDTSADLASWIEAWRTTCGAITFHNESGLSGVPDTTRATDHTFTHAGSDFPESPEITWKHESLANTPTVVKVIYTDTSALPWRDGTDARVAKSGVDAGTTPLRESTIYARGIHRKSEAVRLATKRLNAYALTNLRVSFPLFDEGIEVCAGDVVEITHPVGFSSKTLRVLSNPIQSAGRWLVDGYEYDSAVYSNYLVTEPSSPDFGLNIGASFPRIFISEPTTPYKIGDLWTGGPSGDIKRCKTARTSGAYQAGDWELASEYDATDYTDGRVRNGFIENNVLTILRPGGAAYNGPTGDTGAIVITLPQSWTSTMMTFVVDVFQYTTSKSFTLQVGGYNYSTSSQWVNETANLMGSTAADNRVRFGHDGTKCCIVIGETDSVWNYPQISVRNFQAGHLNYTLDQWDDGWSVSTETSLAGYTFTGDFSDALIDAKTIVNQGGLATVNEADADVLNMTHAPAESGANVTESRTANNASNYTGNSIGTTYTVAKCTDATADKTSTHESLSAKYLDGSTNRSTDDAVEIKKDLKMQDGVDISFYSSSTYRGGIYGGATGIQINSNSGIFLTAASPIVVNQNLYPNPGNTKTCGTSSYRWDNMYSQKLNISTGDVTMGSVGSNFVLHVYDTGSSSWVTYDSYIT